METFGLAKGDTRIQIQKAKSTPSRRIISDLRRSVDNDDLVILFFMNLVLENDLDIEKFYLKSKEQEFVDLVLDFFTTVTAKIHNSDCCWSHLNYQWHVKSHNVEKLCDGSSLNCHSIGNFGCDQAYANEFAEFLKGLIEVEKEELKPNDLLAYQKRLFDNADEDCCVVKFYCVYDKVVDTEYLKENEECKPRPDLFYNRIIYVRT